MRKFILPVLAVLIAAGYALPDSGTAAAVVEDTPAETAVLEVEGLWHSICEVYLERVLLGDVRGVRDVEADHEKDRVTVVFEPGEVSVEDLVEAIHSCCFYRVTGSETHDLGPEILARSRQRDWCPVGLRCSAI